MASLLVNLVKSLRIKKTIAGTIIKMSAFALIAPGKSNCIILMKAVVNPHAGHLNPNNELHKQGIVISISEIDFINAEIKRYNKARLVSLLYHI